MTVDWSPFIPTSTLSREACPANISPFTENFSSTDDTFDEGYLADTFSMQPDYSLDEWVVPDYFERPASSIELPVGFAPKTQGVLTSTLPAAAAAIEPLWANGKAPFGQLNSYEPQATFQPNALPFGTIDTTTTFPPSRNGSLTPSLCGDGSHSSFAENCAPSPATSVSLKRESTSEDTEEPEPKRVARKRGRPRINRVESDPTNDGSYADSQKYRSSRRLPHNQVERKYREGLNSELERLRRAVPTLPQRDSADLTGPPKPSKATVLASAIDYIKFMEAEHERLAEENERLRGIRPLTSSANRAARTKMQNVGWNSKARSDSTVGALPR